MPTARSFTEYVKKRFEDMFWNTAENYVAEQFDVNRIDFRTIHSPGDPELIEVEVRHVWAESGSGMEIRVDVALEITIEIPDRNHHYDNSEKCRKWLMLRCRGDLDKNLNDFIIYECEEYIGRNRPQAPLDDSLVPIIHKEQLEEESEKFLKKYYPKALLEPTAINVDELVRNIGLTLKVSNISKDASVFGRCFFYDCEMTLYDYWGKPHTELIKAGTVLVDFNSTFLSVEGATHNTIVHECVHWELHKKPFALARLYDRELTNIGCKVVGGVADNKRDSFDWMEWQANALAPRIMMPTGMLIKRADALISKYFRENPEHEMIDIIERVIDDLADTFGVSRLAAKIRMLDAGYDEAGGAFIYIDGHYVKTNKAPKGYLKDNQTFAISAKDALLQGLVNKDLCEYLYEGRYLFIDNHYVLNTPKYVESDPFGALRLTRYARNHMDECCLVFDLSVKGPYETRYHHECFLNRDRCSDVGFEVRFNNGFEHSPEKQRELLEKTIIEDGRMASSLIGHFPEDLNQVMEWRNKQIEEAMKTNKNRDISKISGAEIARRTGLNADHVRRILKGENMPEKNTLVLICLALHLPYCISSKILEHANCRLDLQNRDEALYDFVLRCHYAQTVDEVKQHLIEYGATPL